MFFFHSLSSLLLKEILMDTILTEMEFDALATGEFTISPEGVKNVIGNKNVQLLDVRTDEEAAYSPFPFAKHIPINQLPDRIDEIASDAITITFGSSSFQSTVAFFYLRQSGMETVKTMVGGTEDLVTLLKPTPLSSIHSAKR